MKPVWEFSLRRKKVGEALGPLNTPADALEMLLGLELHAQGHEHIVSVALSQTNHVLGIYTVALAPWLRTGEVFRAAIVMEASRVLLAHSKPSGPLTPSAVDFAMIMKLAEVGDLIGIKLIDHLLLGDPEAYFSFREAGHLC